RLPVSPSLLLSVALALAALVPTHAAAPSTLPAFPGAEGFGATTPGGRGGKILFVTNLDDSGPGSLREACEVASGPRIVLFRVAGTIALKKPIVVRNPFLTLAGQSAPGDGVCLRDNYFGIATHDVIVRYLRSRLGDTSKQESDCIDLLNGAHDCILDHCSATWSVDECLSTSGDNQNCTMQWCLIGESLNQSKHAKGKHGYGSLARANGPMSWHHNLWIHNDARNPRLGDNYGRGGKFPEFDVRNNVIYDFGGTASGLTQGKFTANYVGNYLRPGPSSKARTPIHIGNKPVDSDIVFYLHDNVLDGDAAQTADNAKMIDAYELDGKPQARTSPTPFPAAPVKTVSATAALDLILATVGASLPVRDSVDARLVSHVRTRGGKLIDSQNEVGGWPVLKTGPLPLDTDGDGLPDAWELAHGLDPKNPKDASALAKSGYTHLEEFLNAIVAR
ncbi:MAG: hypothetical protein RLZZ15_2851, partial [Verrucomicrobiota bacterium]